MERQPNRNRNRVFLAATLAFALVPPSLAGAAEVKTLEGKAALAHPASQAILAAAKLLRAGKLAEVKGASTAEVRKEWASLSAAEQRQESERAQKNAPEPKWFEAEIARAGELALWDQTAKLTLSTADGSDVLAIGFAELEGGQWRITAGPKSFAPAPVETAPALAGAAILQHEIGKLAVEYARRLEAGKLAAALELLSVAAREKRAAEPPAEQKASDDWRRRNTPKAAALAAQIRDGGRVSFFGERAGLNVITHETQKNADGSVTSTSSTLSMPFVLERGAWRIAD